ncbi:MAG: methyltransferase domain-containing protein, partial [Acidobacteria bacterium]
HLHRLAAATHPLPFRPGSFDAVACNLVLGHVPDLDAALDAIAAVLRPGGCLLLSDFHPEATARGWQRTFRDAAGEERAIVQYLHPLDDYRAACERLGLALEALDEPRWRGQPVVFVLRARKLPGRTAVNGRT